MLEFILSTIFWTLAFYGLFELFKILYGREEYFRNIIVADLESTDKTKEIAKKLSKEYECLKVINWKECRDLMDNIDEN